MFGDHSLCGLLEEGAYEKSPKCLGVNLGDFGEFCKGLWLYTVSHTREQQEKVNTFVNALKVGGKNLLEFLNAW